MDQSTNSRENAKRTRRVASYLNLEEFEWVEEQARKKKVSIAAFLRMLVAEAMEKQHTQ